MAKATKLPSGNWRAVAFVGTDENGKKIRKSFTANTKREAELLATQYLAQKHHNDLPKNKTVETAVTEYIDNKTNVLSPSTIRGYRSVLRNMPDWLLILPLSAVDNQMMQKAVNRYAAEHSPKTVRNFVALLSSSLSQANVDITMHLTLPQKEKKKIRIPSTEEVQAILSHIRGTNYESPVMLAAYMGLRRSEIVALTWDDIDFSTGILTVERAEVMDEEGEWQTKGTKTFSGTRALTMPKPVVEMLAERKEKSLPVCSINASTITSKFPDYVKAAGVEEFNFHALRHYYASVMLSLNIPNKYAQRRMGHATDNMLKNVYQHLMQSKIDETDRLIDNYFSH